MSVTRGAEPIVDENEPIPPIVRCAHCGALDCAGCQRVSTRPSDEPALDWEDSPAALSERLWLTAVASSVEPARVFGRMRDGSLWRALTFSLLVEVMAIGSLGVALALPVLAIAPEFGLELLRDRAFFGTALVGLVSASLLMVFLHAAWGVCLEWGAQRAGSLPHFRMGLRFGLYACGWDLLTSPIGVAHQALRRGPRHAFETAAAAARVPRRALALYMEECRRFPQEAQRRATRASIYAIGLMVLAIAIGVGAGALEFAQAWGLW